MNRCATKRYKINERQVCEWQSIIMQLLGPHSKARKLLEGGCKSALPEMEDKLTEWIKLLRTRNSDVITMMKSRALELIQVQVDENFPVS